MSYWDNITAIADEQRDKGIRKYGQQLERNSEYTADGKIRMIEEELIDALMYLEWLKESVR